MKKQNKNNHMANRIGNMPEIQLLIDGCKVRLNFSAQDNHNTIENIKNILINSVIERKVL